VSSAGAALRSAGAVVVVAAGGGGDDWQPGKVAAVRRVARTRRGAGVRKLGV